MTLKAIIEEASKLSTQEKAELLDQLLCMVGPEFDAAPLTPEQEADLDMRIDEYERGEAGMLPGDEVLKRLRKRK